MATTSTITPCEAYSTALRCVVFKIITELNALQSTCCDGTLLTEAAVTALIQQQITDGTITLPTNLDSVTSNGTGGVTIISTDESGVVTTETIQVSQTGTNTSISIGGQIYTISGGTGSGLGGVTITDSGAGALTVAGTDIAGAATSGTVSVTQNAVLNTTTINIGATSFTVPAPGTTITQKTIPIPVGTNQVDMSTAAGIPAGAVLQPVYTSGDNANHLGIRSVDGTVVYFDANSTTNILHINCLV